MKKKLTTLAPIALLAVTLTAQVAIAVSPPLTDRVLVLTPVVHAAWVETPRAPAPSLYRPTQVRPSPSATTWPATKVVLVPPLELQRRPPATRASRSTDRPPLAERSRWSTSPDAGASSGASASPHSVTPTAAVAASSSAPTDLERAESLPAPWRAIVRCESLGDRSYRVSSPSRARGFFQFLRSTWRSLGLSGDPAAAPFWKQYAAALRLAARDGIRHSWVCARQLGL